jgi:hypothetical protein
MQLYLVRSGSTGVLMRSPERRGDVTTANDGSVQSISMGQWARHGRRDGRRNARFQPEKRTDSIGESPRAHQR